MKSKRWFGTFPTNCNWCHAEIKKPLESDSGMQAFYDANLPGIGWGLWCPLCFKQFGGKLGEGLGQKYSTSTLEKLG